MLTIDHLLADACGNPDSSFDPKLSLEENIALSDGWMRYEINTHCSNYIIVARRVTDGVFDESTGLYETPPHYEIRSYTLNDKLVTEVATEHIHTLRPYGEPFEVDGQTAMYQKQRCTTCGDNTHSFRL